MTNKQKPNETSNEPIDRERILKQREGLQATLDQKRIEVAFYEGALASLDYLLNPTQEPAAEPTPEPTD